MRNVIFIGRAGCNSCWYLYETVIKPLQERYKRNVSVHYGWDATVQRVNKRKQITRIPLIVVERDGREEFRYSGRLEPEELAAIIEYEGDTITLDDVLGGDFR